MVCYFFGGGAVILNDVECVHICVLHVFLVCFGRVRYTSE